MHAYSTARTHEHPHACSHTRTHAHARTQTQVRTRTHVRTDANERTCVCAHTNAHNHIHAHARTHSLTHTHSWKCQCMHARAKSTTTTTIRSSYVLFFSFFSSTLDLNPVYEYNKRFISHAEYSSKTQISFILSKTSLQQSLALIPVLLPRSSRRTNALLYINESSTATRTTTRPIFDIV